MVIHNLGRASHLLEFCLLQLIPLSMQVKHCYA